MSIVVLRDKLNPNKIRSKTYTMPTEKEPKPLGEFDESIFEQVVLEALPDGWEEYKEIPEAQPVDLLSTLATAFGNNAKRDSIKALLSDPDVLADIVYLLISRSTLTLEEYEAIKTNLSNGAIKAGFPQKQVNALSEAADTNFKNKRKFIDVK